MSGARDGGPPARRRFHDPELAALSPGPEAPEHLHGRSFSWSLEFYRRLQRSHRTLLEIFNRCFPNPLMVPQRAMDRAGLRGGRVRGGVVRGEGMEGRLVGRHPSTGAPVVAWSQEAYGAICAAFDDENAARIEAWRRVTERLRLTTGTAGWAALWLDRLVRLVATGAALLSFLILMVPIGGALGSGALDGAGDLGVVFAGSAMGALMVGIASLIVGFFLEMAMRPAAALVGAVAGLWAAALHRQASAADADGAPPPPCVASGGRRGHRGGRPAGGGGAGGGRRARGPEPPPSGRRRPGAHPPLRRRGRPCSCRGRRRRSRGWGPWSRRAPGSGGSGRQRWRVSSRSAASHA